MESSLTNQEKDLIFENVNTMYLNLTGTVKKQTKSSFKLWKEDGLQYKMMIILSEVYDKWSEREQNEDWEYDKSLIGTQTISEKKFRRYLNFSHQSNEEIQKELDKIKKGKGYISEETHKEEMAEQLREQQEIIRGISDQLGKARHQAKHFEDKCELQSKDLHAKIEYYKHELNNKIYQ
tara:strand:- start:435 stop:971 length:537 start_codon:yes stop_codon:yes gene_type:complete